jgi:hypothetical protein
VLIALADAAALASSYIGKQLGEDGEIAIETVSDVPPGHAVSMVTMREWLGSQMKLKLESRGSEIWRFQRLDPDKPWMLPPLISGVVVSSFDSERHALETIWNTYHGVGGNGE